MNDTRTIFVSAVSNEFHDAREHERHLFASYRDVIKQAFRSLAPHYEVIVQEDLPIGMSSLLETLDREVERSLLVIHLVGERAGAVPQPVSVTHVLERYPEFLSAQPALRDALGECGGISYTQWEIYLAFHHRKHSLLFEAESGAVRSPVYTHDEAEERAQRTHRQRLELTDAHRGSFRSQADVARRSMRSFLHARLDPSVDPVEPTDEARAAAWEDQDAIVEELRKAIAKPDPHEVPAIDPANVASFVAAVRSVAGRRNVDMCTIVNIAARHEEQMRAAAEDRPEPAALYDQALAELALGEFTAAAHTARRAANLAKQQRDTQPEDAEHYQECAQNALFLLHDAAKGDGDVETAIAALREAGGMIDREGDPILWADAHEPLAETLVENMRFDEARELIDEIVDIREDLQGERDPALPKALMLWGKLLWEQKNPEGAETVLARAERLLLAIKPRDPSDISAVLNNRARVLQELGRPAEAEPLLQRAVEIAEAVDGPDHPVYAICLGNWAKALESVGRRSEAEPLLQRVLSIHEQYYGSIHPYVAATLTHLGGLYTSTNRAADSEPLYRRALDIAEEYYGVGHPRTTDYLEHLAAVLQVLGRSEEAVPLAERALAITERTCGHEHLRLEASLALLAVAFHTLNRNADALPLVERRVNLLASVSQRDGREHPHFQAAMENYLSLLLAMKFSDDQIKQRLFTFFQRHGMVQG